MQLSCAGDACVAVRDNGTVLVWGRYNPVKELKSDTPREVPGLSGVKKVAAGSEFFLALKQDGSVWSWGVNRHGVLGINTLEEARFNRLTDSEVPVRIAGLTGVADISVMGHSAFALKSDGTVWAWGYHSNGSLGTGLIPSPTPARRPASMDQPFPVQVAGLQGVKQVAAGFYHALALLQDGRVMGWGSNSLGAVGDGTTEHRWEPVPVKGLADVIKVAAGSESSLAILKDGTVRVWGNNSSGILLNGTKDGFHPEPIPVSGIRTAVDGAAGAGHMLVLLASGSIQCWGFNGWGHCGDGKTGGYALSIVTTRNISGVAWMGAGANSSFAMTKDGRLMGWGALYTEPMNPGGIYWSALPVEWTEQGWFRPAGYARKPQ